MTNGLRPLSLSGNGHEFRIEHPPANMHMKQPRSKIFLSRRNLLALLSKLDRVRAGEMSACSIIKHQSARPAYRQTSKAIIVTAVEDEPYYSALQRSAGAMVEADERHLSKPPQGIAWPIDFLDSESDDEDVIH